MDNVSLVVQPRDVIGSRAARRLRNSGLVPGVLYGHGEAATLIAVDPRSLREALATDAGMHAVLDVKFEGKKAVRHAVVKELDLDPVRSTVRHVDLQEIRLTETIESAVAITFEGDCKGVKAGGILDEVTHQVTVRGVVTAIPEHIALDISDLDVNDSARISDLVLPEGIQVLDDPDQVVCSILTPRVAEAALGEEAEAAPAQPEIVGKAKKEEVAD